MIRSLLLLALGLSALFASGCLFSRKPRVPKENQAIASETEAIFRQRWIDRRTSELTARGLAAEAARTQAAREFGEQFAFGTPIKK